jgi:hypothetical protein
MAASLGVKYSVEFVGKLVNHWGSFIVSRCCQPRLRTVRKSRGKETSDVRSRYQTSTGEDLIVDSFSV